ncbi:hypothetical protein RclHR1_00250025 [Rhizophagus clarus]|uniref:Uncharacterized protein n=1 Tax=Rhizophagus clarus TaxID=94130 RepID=A0A2Z6QYH9_9GLOM|nr:hypothetical protein RclHR1_00250025 [Rhizophagus clarus]
MYLQHLYSVRNLLYSHSFRIFLRLKKRIKKNKKEEEIVVDEFKSNEKGSDNNSICSFVSKKEEIKEDVKEESIEESGNNNVQVVEEENKEVKEKVEISHNLTIHNYNTINNIIQTQQPEQPERPESESPFYYRVIKKIVKEVGNIVDKVAQVHKEAILKSNANKIQESTEVVV